jgi:non-specific serine/threonine protein kinase
MENWRNEAARFAPELRTVIISGPDRNRQFHQLNDIDLAITSFALLRRDTKLYENLHFDYIIIDEAQHIKNARTANAKACKRLKGNHRLVLTGTPVENSPMELWSIFDFLQPGYLPLIGAKGHSHGSLPRGLQPSDLEGLSARIRPFVLRRTKQAVCQELPEKMEQIIHCEMREEQRQLYSGILLAGRQLAAKARQEGWNRHRMEMLTILLRLRQVCCHPALLPTEFLSASTTELESAKLELAQEVILEAIDSGHRILLFSQFTSMLQLFIPWLRKNHIAFEYLDGSTTHRQQHVDHFNQSTDIPIFLLSL